MVNWKVFSDDVKVDYENCIAKVSLWKSDIFTRVNGKWEYKKYENDFTKEPLGTPGVAGTQLRMSIIEFPDAPWSGSAGVLTKQWNYLINMGGYIKGFLDQLTKDQEKDFKQCLSKIEKCDACSFYHIYEVLCEKSKAYRIWLLPYGLFRRGLSDPREIICGD